MVCVLALAPSLRISPDVIITQQFCLLHCLMSTSPVESPH